MDSTRLVNPIGGGKRLDYNDLAKAFGMLREFNIKLYN